jgi:pentatricopeptide repeat protein
VKRRMMESGLQLDQFTYKALVHGFCKAKELDEAKEALFEMMGAGTTNLTKIYGSDW